MKSNGFTKYSPTEIHCTHNLAYINNLKLRTVYKNYLIFMVHVSHLFGISRNNCIYSVNKMHVHFDFNEVPITFSPSPFLLRFFFELKKKQNNKLRFQFKLKS